MNDFGSRLRAFRLRSADAQTKKPLTQERLGGLLIEKMGVGVSGAAVSDWERGKSKIHADDRLLLVSLIKILRENGGILSSADANELLDAGNYRRLNAAESGQVFADASSAEGGDLPAPKSEGIIFAGAREEWTALLEKAREGPPPAWPRVVTAGMRALSDRLSPLDILQIICFFVLWALTRLALVPSLSWPFSDEAEKTRAIILYIAGTLIIPPLTGLLAETKSNPFWRASRFANASVLRLYTHQGAFIGFHLGYFAVFFAALVQDFLRLTPSLWFAWMAALAPLAMSYVGARVVPYNLWRAFGRLDLRDGGIFFAFALAGPAWGFFLARFSPVLTSVNGLLLALFAISLLAGGMARRASKKAE